MKKIIAGTLALLLCSNAFAEYCTLSREEVSGNNKFCFYGCVGGEKVITINSLHRCPLMQSFAAYGHGNSTASTIFLASSGNTRDNGNMSFATRDALCNSKQMPSPAVHTEAVR